MCFRKFGRVWVVCFVVCVCVHFNRMHCSAGVWTEHKQDRFSHGDLLFGIYYALCGNGVIS